MQAPPVVSRSAWGAAGFKGTVQSLGAIRRIVVHHAAGFRAATLADGKRQMRDIQKLHQGPARNWADIGYHFLIGADGTIFQGRPYFKGTTLANVERFGGGAHVLGQNTGKLGICLLGCFHPPETGCNDVPTTDAFGALEALIRFVAQAHQVEAANIKTHRDFVSTDCPGDTLHAAVATLREKLAAEEL